MTKLSSPMSMANFSFANLKRSITRKHQELPFTDHLRTGKMALPCCYQGSFFAKGVVWAQPLPPGGQKKIAASYDWVDWIGTSNLSAVLEGKQELREIPKHRYMISTLGYGRNIWGELFQIRRLINDAWVNIAEIEAHPRAGFIDEYKVKIKLQNKFCYQEHDLLIEDVQDICRAINMDFEHYCRIDIAADFQELHIGDSCEDFLQKIAGKQYQVKGKRMKVEANTKNYEGVTWGRRVSGMSITMYNKTKLMQQVGKPWVNELWDKAEFNKSQDTYRLEFSTVYDMRSMVDEETGNVYLNYSNINYLKQMDIVLPFLYTRYFKVSVNTGNKKKDNRFHRKQKVEVLNISKSTIKNVRLSEKDKSTNYVRHKIKTTFLDAIQYQERGDLGKASYLFEYVNDLLYRHDLQDWFDKKFGHVEYEQLQIESPPEQYMKAIFSLN